MQETLTLTPGRAQWQEGMSLTKDTKAPSGLGWYLSVV